jgi:1,4-dihydroxy-2-naphthoate octaprenyltransferase
MFGRTISTPWLLLGTLMLVVSQASLELLDGYYDYVQGAHHRKDGAPTWTGGSGVLAEGALSPRAVRQAGAALGALAATLFAVVTVCWTRGEGVVVGLVGCACGAFWAMPPFKLSYRGLGEVIQGIVVGPLMAAQAWVVATGHLDARAFLVGVPFGLLEFAMGLAHNILDRESDALVGKNTLVVRVGEHRAAILHALAVFAGLASMFVFAFGAILPRGAALVAVMALPGAVFVCRLVWKATDDGPARTELARTFPGYYLLMFAGAGAFVAGLFPW